MDEDGAEEEGEKNLETPSISEKEITMLKQSVERSRREYE